MEQKGRIHVIEESFLQDQNNAEQNAEKKNEKRSVKGVPFLARELRLTSGRSVDEFVGRDWRNLRAFLEGVRCWKVCYINRVTSKIAVSAGRRLMQGPRPPQTRTTHTREWAVRGMPWCYTVACTPGDVKGACSDGSRKLQEIREA